MTIVLRHNADLELNLVEYQGSVSLAELLTLVRFAAANPKSLKHDTLTLVVPGADFRTVPLDALDSLWEQYRALYQPLEFQIFRRSAWLCQSEAAQAHVNHWLADRNMREAMSSDVRLFDTFADVGDWLVLSEAGVASLQRGEGFVEVLRLHEPAEVPRAATR